MWDDILRLAPAVGCAIGAGGILGLDREFRARPAGLRTHILVCLASAALMLAPSHQQMWLDPSRVATEGVLDPTRMGQGIMTGIGFLGAGVIFRNGLTIHGLTTAASLWVTAGIGILFGLEFYAAGWLSTVAAALVLGGLHWIDHHLPGEKVADATLRFERGREPDFEAIKRRLKEAGCVVRQSAYRLTEEAVEQEVVLKSYRPFDAFELGRQLQTMDGLIGVELRPR